MNNIVFKSAEFSTIDRNKRIISGWISKFEVDRDGEIVDPVAFEKHLDIYMKNGPLLLFHNHRSLPCGKILNVKIIPNEGVWGEFYITKNPLGEEVLTLIEEGCLNGFSPGFVPIRFEENPPIQKIPHHVLKTSLGKKIRKYYQEVEWVETSLLPIPSNRSALIDRAEKGNSVANLIVKSFDIEKYEDLDIVIKEWMDSHKPKYTLKSLLKWDENEHPRDNDGRFTESSHVKNVLDPIRESNYYPSEVNPRYDSTNRAANQTVKRVEESNQKLDKVIEKQDEMIGGVKKIRDNTSWKSWFAKYAIGIATAVGAYLLWKHGHKIKVKEFDDGHKKSLQLLGTIEQFLAKGEELGVTDTIEYQKMKKFYDSAMKTLSGKELKGLSSIYVTDKGYFYTIAKEMSAETFDESEHPRSADGKFRKKNTGAGVALSKNSSTQFKVKKNSTNVDDHAPVAAVFKKPKERAYLRDWAKEHKKALFIAAGVASFPVVFATARFGGRLFKAVYSDAAKRTVTWDKLTVAERQAWREQVQPGDIFLQGGKAHDGFSDFLGDLMNVKKSGDAKNRVNETLIKAVNGSHYGHSAMVVGKYDLKFHQRTCDAFLGKKGVLEKKRSFQILSGLEDNGQQKVLKTEGKGIITIPGVGTGADIRQAMKVVGSANAEQRAAKIVSLRRELRKLQKGPFPNETKAKKKELLEYMKSDKIVRGWDDFYNGKGAVSETFGQFIIASASTGNEQGKSQIFLYVTDHPMGGSDATGAILRTKVDKKTREEMSQKIIDASFGGKHYDIAYSMGLEKDFSARRMDTLLKKVGDPASAKVSEAFLKDDKVLCSGAIAKFYKIFGNIDTDKEAKYLFPHDILKDSKLGGMVLEAGKKEWKTTGELLDDKRAKRATRIAGGIAGGTTAGTVGYKEREDIKQRAEEYKKKFVKKAMSAEQFEESEHPRDSDGKFTSSGNTSSSGVGKVDWGGKREFSGRLPKDAHNAVPRLREKYKSQNPEASDQEIDGMVKKYAEDNLKPDIYQFLDNPEQYWQEQDQKRKDALLSKYNNAKSGGRSVKPVRDSSDLDEVVDSVNKAKGEFDQEVQKSTIIQDAWKTFKDKNASQMDVDAARLTLAIAGVASVLGLAVMFRKFPDLAKTKFVKVRNAGKTALREGEILGGSGKPTELGNHKWMQFNRIVKNPSSELGLDTANELQDVNAFNRWFSTAIKRLTKDGTQGDQWALSMGSKWHGFKGRFNLRSFRPVSTHDPKFNYAPRANDMDLNGLQLVDSGGKIRWNNVLWSKKIINEQTSTQKLAAMGLKKQVDKNTGKFLGFDIKDEKKLASWLVKNGHASPVPGKGVSGLDSITWNKQTFPEYIYQHWNPEEYQAFQDQAAQYMGMAEFLEKKVGNVVSRKVLAQLAAAGAIGSTAGFVFYKDIKRNLAELGQDIKKEEELQATADKKTIAIVNSKKSQNSEVARINALTRLANAEKRKEEAAAKRDMTSQALESARSDTREKLVALAIRRDAEGAQPLFSFTADTMYKRLRQSGRLDTMKGINEILEILKDKKKSDALWQELYEAEKAEQEREAQNKTKKDQKKQGATAEDYGEAGRQSQHDSEEVASKSFDDFVTKMMEDVDLVDGSQMEGPQPLNFDAMIDATVDDVIEQFEKISKCCATVSEAGMPGHTDYEEINDILATIYMMLKDKNKESPEDDSEINNKSFDTSGVMSSTIDANGGMFVGDEPHKKNETCKVCGRVVSEDDIAQCDNTKCPYDFQDTIKD